MYNNRYNAKLPINPQRTDPQYRGRNITSLLKEDLKLIQLIEMAEDGFIKTRDSVGLRIWLADLVTHLITDDRPKEATRWWLQETGDYVDGFLNQQQALDNLDVYSRALSPAEKNSYVFYWASPHDRLQSLAINYCLTIIDNDFYYSINQLLDTLREYWESIGAAQSWKDAESNLAKTMKNKLLEFYTVHINRQLFSWR